MAATPTPSSSLTSLPTFSFHLKSSPTSPFGPRLGRASLNRGNNAIIDIDTPGFLTTTSRGIIPHLSRDHQKITLAINWVHLPFESFLDRSPPVPTLQGGPNPLHTFLGFSPSQNTILLSVRDPSDGREMPPNGNDHISAYTLRGVRKISPSTWRAYVHACKPDLVLALSDTPFTQPPYSQKRITKSLDRSIAWLADLLRPSSTDSALEFPPHHALNVLVQMAGHTNIAARTAFSTSLTEPLHGGEAQAITPFKCLDDGVVGYVFDLLPLRLSLLAETPTPSIPTTPANAPQTQSDADLPSLLQASLHPLPRTKLRLTTSPQFPHEILRLIRDVGVDMFDARWAQEAADVGIALDFGFPVPDHVGDADVIVDAKGRAEGEEGGVERKLGRKRRWDLGHNLYDPIYAHDFGTLAECFVDGASSSPSSYPYPHQDSNSNRNSKSDATTNNTNTPPKGWPRTRPICLCAACSPLTPHTPISHSALDDFGSYLHPHSEQEPPPTPRFQPPFTRAYIHHLLHTHEMSAHALLAMHNLSILSAFFLGVRTILGGSRAKADSGGIDSALFAAEVDRFMVTYDETMGVFDRARKDWLEVETARGKGRLAREREKEKVVEVEVERKRVRLGEALDMLGAKVEL